MSKPRILFVGPLPPPYSGPELSMKQLLESSVLNDSLEIDFLKTNFRKDNTKKGKLGLAMILNFFLFFSKLFYKLVIFRPVLVYYPITPTQIGWLGRDAWTIIIAKFTGAKIVIHLRGSHFKLNFAKFNKHIKSLVGYSLKKVDVGIVQANYLRDQFEPFLSKSKTKVLYQSIEPEEFSNSDLKNYQKGKILVVGHMTKAKGYTDILKVIPEVASEFPEVVFSFAGNMRRGERGVFYNQVNGEPIIYEDPYEKEEQILNGKFAKNYKNLGLISGAEKLEEFRSCDLFVSASYSEGFSRSLLEAMTIGKPLVYTPVGAHREVFEDKKNGLCVDPGDAAGLADAIKKLLQDRKLHNAIGNRNYLKSREDFSLEKIASDFKEIINNVIQK